MNRTLWGTILAVLLVAGLVKAQQVVDQGMPGNQGAWPVTMSGGGTSPDGGFTYTAQYPCQRIVFTNDAGYGTSPSRVPMSGPHVGRIWIRICNSPLNSASTQCICATDNCPSSVAQSVQGDVLLTADCVTYPITAADAGTPCCVCNGAGSYLPTAECVP